MTRVTPEGRGRRPDELIVEEPMTVQLDGVVVTTTMRTPGHDFELAAGFCVTEGLLAGARPRRSLLQRRGQCAGHPSQRGQRRDRRPGPDPDAAPRYDVVELRLVRERPDRRVGGPARPTATDDRRSTRRCWWRCPIGSSPTSACSASPGRCTPRPRSTPPARCWCCVRTSAATTPSTRWSARMALAGQLPASGHGLFVSGRASIEMVQKAWAAGFAAIVSVSAPDRAGRRCRSPGRSAPGRVRAARRLQRLRRPCPF